MDEVEEVKVEVFRNIYGRGRTYSGAKLGKVRRGLQSLQLVLVGEVRRPEIIGHRRAVKMSMMGRGLEEKRNHLRLSSSPEVGGR